MMSATGTLKRVECRDRRAGELAEEFDVAHETGRSSPISAVRMSTCSWVA